jgi:hypothetical protein
MTATIPTLGSTAHDRLVLDALRWESANRPEGEPLAAVYDTLLGILIKGPVPELDFVRDGWTFDQDPKFAPQGAWIPGDALPPSAADPPIGDRSLALEPGPGAGFGPVVGVLDTKICPHPALAGCYAAPGAVYREASELDVVEPRGIDPFAPHATFLAGIIAQQAPSARILVRSVIRRGRATLDDILEGLVELKEAGAQVINLSLGAFTKDDEKPESLEVVLRLLGPEIVLVAAAGNRRSHQQKDPRDRSGLGSSWWPAALEGVVAVGSAHQVDAGWLPSDFSNRGPWVNVWAPGEEVVSTYVDFPDDNRDDDPYWWRWARWSGTSFAAAVVSGRIAAQVAEASAAGAPVTAWQALDRLLAESTTTVQLDEPIGGSRGSSVSGTLIEPTGPLRWGA